MIGWTSKDVKPVGPTPGKGPADRFLPSRVEGLVQVDEDRVVGNRQSR